MFSQSADQPAPDQSPAPIGMRELPPQPAKPVMPAYATTTSERSGDDTGPSPDDSVVAKDDHFEGTFTSRGTVRVEGSVKGRIEAVRVRIEDGAQVDADVIVDEAIIAGEFTGNLTCRDRLEARPSGRISGRVETHKLMLHEGASVEGEMHMLTEAPTDAAETIRGSAPLRGEPKAPVKSEPAKSETVKRDPAKAEPLAPAPRSAVDSGSSTARTGSSAGTATSSSEPKPTPRIEAASPQRELFVERLKVTPRAATATGSGNGARNGSKTTSGF